MALEADRRLAGNYNFVVSLRRSASGESGAASPPTPNEGDGFPGDGGFQECSGLDLEMDVQEINEGGRNDGVIRRFGRGKFSNLVLKRGMFYGADYQVNTAVWGWLQGILEGKRPFPRYDGTVQLLSADHSTPLATWTFIRGVPAKVTGPQLNAKTGDVAIEELHIAHEGLKLGM
ncbi:MAG TPA: phage tail protein [Longimicrobium sp.]|jgi:phage tail-like protein|uniref:phage tail protein n=1 Tax=Longimicrobium sp. TaxID=2029185 RepID=UPI002EDB933F